MWAEIEGEAGAAVVRQKACLGERSHLGRERPQELHGGPGDRI